MKHTTQTARRTLLMTLVMPLALLISPALQAQDIEPDRNDPRIRLLEAVVKNDAKTVQKLLVAGVDPNVREAARGPAVVMAASEKSYDVLEELAAAPQTNLDATNKNGETALMVVSRLGHLPSVSVLLKRGASINRKDWTPLHMAASNGHVNVVKKLIQANADVDAKSDNGTTPMMLAARMGQFSAYQELVLAGADPTIINESKLSAADYLEQKGETERATLLRKYSQKYKSKTLN